MCAEILRHTHFARVFSFWWSSLDILDILDFGYFCVHIGSHEKDVARSKVSVLDTAKLK
jgi:hypothetical protein